jgi:TonB family protein
MLVNDLDSQRNTLIGLIYSVALHAVLILLYVGWTWITSENDTKVIGSHYKTTFIDIAPPPSVGHDISLPPPVAPPHLFSKPTFGIPIPIANIKSSDYIMPENNMPISRDQNSSPGNIIGTTENAIGTPFDIKVVVPDKPDRNIFVAVDEDPKPVQDIQSLVQYPEQAKRSNLEGKVSYSALIGIDGRVKEVLIDKSDYDVFKQAVIDALMRTQFVPARVDNTPVQVYYNGTISFRLH